MDKLFDTYKQIVDRAISLGLLSEDSKSYYLSACGEEAAPDSTIKTYNSCDIQVKHDQLQTSFEKANSLSRANSEELKQNLNLTIEKSQDEDNTDCEDRTPVAGRSIENYSILDINNFIKMANSAGSDSEPSDILKAACNISPGDSPIFKLNKVRRKPRKNEIVDFQIPIYLDVKRKKVRTKSSKVKRYFSLQEKERINFEPSSLQNEDEEESLDERIKNKKTFQASRSKYCSRIPKRVNLTNKDNNTLKLRSSDFNSYKPSFEYKNIVQSAQRRLEKNVYPSRVVSTPSMFIHSKNRCYLESPLKTNKLASSSKINRESLFEREADAKNKNRSKCTLFRSSNGRRLAFRSSPDVFESKDLAQLPSNDDQHFFKHVIDCKHLEKPVPVSDSSSWKESSDSEANARSTQKLLNLNIICQFFSSDSSGGKRDSASAESFSQAEQVENEKTTSIDSDTPPPKERSTRRSKGHFLSKLFSKTRTH